MSNSAKQRVVVTGISGNLGVRLLRQLSDFDVIGVDIKPPAVDLPLQFESIDLGQEGSCDQMIDLIRRNDARAIIHLAFIVDPLQSNVLDLERMWRVNVAGTGRVMEAISEVNRRRGNVETFIFTSSVSAYGPETPGPVKEDHPLGAHTLPYAIHKQECDSVVRYRASTLGACTTYLLRPPIFTGATVQNYQVGLLRGAPSGRGKLAQRLRRKGSRLPLLLPSAKKYLQKKFQFIHVDDMARLLSYLLRQTPHGNRLVTMNVAGAGEALSIEASARIADQTIIQLPSQALCQWIVKLLWDFGVSAVPPEAYPYMIGSYTMDTSLLRQFLGKDYDRVIQMTMEEALRDSFRKELVEVTHTENAAPTLPSGR